MGWFLMKLGFGIIPVTLDKFLDSSNCRRYNTIWKNCKFLGGVYPPMAVGFATKGVLSV